MDRYPSGSFFLRKGKRCVKYGGYIVNFTRRPYTNEVGLGEKQPPHSGVFIGHYDNVQLLECLNVSDFFFSTDEMRRTAGEKQSIYLYKPNIFSFNKPIEQDAGNKEFVLGKNNAVPYKMDNPRNSKFNQHSFRPRFVCVSVVTFDDAVMRAYSTGEKDSKKKKSKNNKKSQPKDDKKNRLYDKIDRMLTGACKKMGGTYNTDIDFEVLACLGAGHVAILWFSDSLETPAYLLSYLRSAVYVDSKKEKHSITCTDYTIVSTCVSEKDTSKFSPESSDLELQISFTLRNSHANGEKLDQQEFWKDLCRQLGRTDLAEDAAALKEWLKQHVTVRNYNQDAIVRIACKDTPIALINNQKKHFETYTLGAHTRIVGPMSFDTMPPHSISVTNAGSGEVHSAKQIKAALDRTFKATSNLIEGVFADGEETGGHSPAVVRFFSANAHISESIYQIYGDFARCLTTIDNDTWASDLIVQYETFIRCMYNQIGSIDNKNTSVVIRNIRDLIDAMQQNYRHITQGNRVFFDIPGTDLPYNGSFRKVLWTYYGILKHYIRMAYSIPRTVSQSEIVPILQFSHIPTVTSLTLNASSNNGSDTKLVIYTMPYAAFTNIPRFAKFLAHEVHHSFEPIDQELQSRLVAEYVLQDIYNSLILGIWARFNDQPLSVVNRNTQNDRIFGLFRVICYSYVESGFDGLIDYVNKVAARDVLKQDNREISETLINVHVKGKADILVADGRADYDETLVKEFVKYVWEFLNEPQKFTTTDAVIQSPEFVLLRDKFADRTRFEYETLNVADAWYSLPMNTGVIKGTAEACHDYFMLQLWQNDSYEKRLFNYLDFMSDFLFTKQIQIEADGIARYSGQDFCCRIGLQLERQLHEIQENSTAYKKFTGTDKELLDIMLENWIQQNEGYLKSREVDKRNTERVQYRINCAKTFRQMYQQYAMIPNRHYLSNLLKMYGFAYIHTATELNAKKKDELSFFPLARKLIDHNNDFDKIQKNETGSKRNRAVSLFALHTKLFNSYHNQKSLQTMGNEHRQNMICNATVPSWDTVTPVTHKPLHKGMQWIWTHEAATYEEFFYAINRLLGNLSESGQIWFRGQSNAKYKLQPGLHRMPFTNYLQEGHGKLYHYQQGYYDHFMAKASQTIELNTTHVRSELDWIAAMQHYSIPTNLLDWSETLFVAMYFMLEPMILKMVSPKGATLDNEESIKSMEENGASLYVFDPIEYNKCWMAYKKQTLSDEGTEVGEKVSDDCPIKKNNDIIDRFAIPNLSMEGSAKIFSSYVLGASNLPGGCGLTTDKGDEKDINPCKCSDTCPLKYPIAVYTAQSNIRLQQQAGTFTAFSLHYDGDFSNVSLEDVQQHFYKANCCQQPFLYKINVTRAGLRHLAEWLVQSGIRPFRIYPELNNVGDHINLFNKKNISPAKPVRS